MKTTCIALATTGLFALSAGPLGTDYTAKRTLTTDHAMTVEWEITDSGMTLDGEEPDLGGRGGGFGGDASGDSVRRIVRTDHVLATEEGAPTQVMRTFGEIAVTGSMTRGENDTDIDRKSPLSSVKLELKLEEGEVTAKVEEGEEPPEAALAGHRLTLDIDAFLPTEEVEDGATYEIESDAIVRALGLDLDGMLFPRPERTEGERPQRGEGGGGGGRRRGGRGGRGGGGIGPAQLATLAWEAEATYRGTQDVDGEELVVIELQLEADGTLPERQRGRRGRGGDRALTISPATAAFETEATVELKGQLLWNAKANRPVSLELEGEFTVDMQTSRDTERGLFETWRTTEGELRFDITYTEEAL